VFANHYFGIGDKCDPLNILNAMVFKGGAFGVPRRVNLPSWRTVKINMEHILENPTVTGGAFQQSALKTAFSA
jgi:hypothetical protein